MKKILVLLALLLIIPMSSLAETRTIRFYVTIYGNDATPQVNDFSIAQSGTITDFPSSSDYNLIMYTKDNVKLFETPIGVSFTPTEGNIILDSVTLHLRLPYYEDVGRIKILHNDKTILDYSGSSGFDIIQFLTTYWYYIIALIIVCLIIIVIKKYY